MAVVPGTVGWPYVGDKSYAFYKDPISFLQKNMAHHKSRVFAARFLNTPTVFVCSNQGVHDVLTDHHGNFEHGYKAFMEKIFGDNILFAEDDKAHMFRDALGHVFTPDAVDSYEEDIKRIAARHVARLDDRLLEDAKNVENLATTHWHGLISIPVEIKVPGTSRASTYSHALEAKEQLLMIIRTQRSSKSQRFIKRFEEVAKDDQDTFVDNHLLLFSSALVPKALASLLTSFAIEVSGTDRIHLQNELKVEPELKSSVFQEVQRLYPPFLGGRRIARQDVIVDGYRIPKGFAVVYMTYAAHRDPQVFQEPDTFQPRRWLGSGSNYNKHLFSFGLGPRGCLGQQLVWKIVDIVLGELAYAYQWKLLEGQDVMHKYLPVSRPKNSVMVTLQRL